MHIFEVTIPGTWLDYADREWAWKIDNLLRNLQNQFFEAVTALNLFETATARLSRTIASKDWDADAVRRLEIQRQVEVELGGDASRQSWDRISQETELRFKREKWSRGDIPREFETNTVYICARAFIYALDGFEKFLNVLAKESGIPRIAELSESVGELFPDLRGVRNTAQHLEDRSRGLDAGKKPINLQPIQNNAIHAPDGGVLPLNVLNGNRFGCTKSDGHFGEVEISPDSVSKLRVLPNEVLHCFRWSGPVQHLPTG